MFSNIDRLVRILAKAHRIALRNEGFYYRTARDVLISFFSRRWPATFNNKLGTWPENAIIFRATNILDFAEIICLIGILLQEFPNRGIVFPIDYDFCDPRLVQLSDDFGVALLPIVPFDSGTDQESAATCMSNVLRCLSSGDIVIVLDQFDYDIDAKDFDLTPIQEATIINASFEMDDDSGRRVIFGKAAT